MIGGERVENITLLQPFVDGVPDALGIFINLASGSPYSFTGTVSYPLGAAGDGADASGVIEDAVTAVGALFKEPPEPLHGAQEVGIQGGNDRLFADLLYCLNAASAGENHDGIGFLELLCDATKVPGGYSHVTGGIDGDGREDAFIAEKLGHLLYLFRSAGLTDSGAFRAADNNNILNTLEMRSDLFDIFFLRHNHGYSPVV